jgi:hypothetical protein
MIGGTGRGGVAGVDRSIMIIRGGRDAFRQNPPFKIQMISSGASQTITMKI